MARGEKGSLLNGFHGRLNEFLVIKQRNGKPVLCFYPKGKKINWTENQAKHRLVFKSAAHYARYAIKKPELLTLYRQREHDGINAYNLAIADYLHLPVIVSVDIRKARKRDEYLVRVVAKDDFMVASVKLDLIDIDNKASAEEAKQFRKSDLWIYRIGCKKLSTIHAIRAFAYDYPGHHASREYLISPEEAISRLPHS